MTAARGIARAGLIVTSAFLVSRILGSVRLIVIGATFGAGPDLDAFLAAFRIPDFIFQLVAAGALSSALIPVVAGLLATGQEVRAWRVASTVATLMLAALLVLAVIVAIAAPVLVPVITAHFSPDQIQRTIELTRVMLLSPILLAGGALATSLLNARGRFAASAVAPIVYNVAIILAAVFLAPWLGIVGLAIGVVLGAAGHLGIQLLPLRADRLPVQPEHGPVRQRCSPGALADGPPRRRAGRQPAHLPRGDVGLDRPRGRGGDRLHLRLLGLPAADRGDRHPARRGDPAGPLARAGPGRDRALPGPDPAGAPADHLRDGPADRAGDHRPGRGRPDPVRLRPDGRRLDRAHDDHPAVAAPGDHLRVDDRDPGPGLLRRPRHTHAGDRRDHRGRHQCQPVGDPGRTARPGRDRPGDHDRLVGGGGRPAGDPGLPDARPSDRRACSGPGPWRPSSDCWRRVPPSRSCKASWAWPGAARARSSWSSSWA